MAKMQPASSMEEIYKNMTPLKFLTQENEEFYIPVFDQKVKEIRVQLLTDENPVQTIYVSGQTGSGKTTALNFLENEKVQEKFIVEYLYGNQLFDLEDIDVVDILLMLSQHLIEKDDRLKQKFEDRIERLRALLEKEVTQIKETTRKHQVEAGAKAEIGLNDRASSILQFLNLFKIAGNIFANYKYNYDNRKLTREVLTPKRDDLLKIVNELIEEYRIIKAPNSNKRLLLIFHELNHVKNQEAIRKLFVKDLYYLEGVQAKKVVTIPVNLIPLPTFNRDIVNFVLKLTLNPLDAFGPRPEDEENVKNNKAQLRKMLEVRLTEEGQVKIPDSVIEFAINKSGGNIRQFFAILYYAARKVLVLDGNKISTEDARNGAVEEQRKLERTIITKNKIKLLEYIRLNNTLNTDDNHAFLECALSNQVFIYENSRTWYDLNPLIKETVEIYAKRLAATDA